MRTGARGWEMWPQGIPGASRSWKRQEGFPPRSFGGCMALPTLILDFKPPEVGESKPPVVSSIPSLWSFVPGSPGH